MNVMDSDETNDADMYMHTFVDDLSGKMLEPNGVRQARKEEVKLFQEHATYTFVPPQRMSGIHWEETDCHPMCGHT